MSFDFQHFVEMLPDIWKAFGETLYMISISIGIAIVIGLPLGIILFSTSQGLFLQNRYVNAILGFISNLIRSIPFIILIVALIPLTTFIVGNPYRPTGACVALSVAAIPFFARVVETALRDIDKGVIEAAIAGGATPWMIITDVLLPEARSSIVQGITLTLISLVAYSAMAGFVGGGGIGDLAIRFGYYRYDDTIMISTVVILIILVQFLQITGDLIAKKIDKR
ncbi:methionine ABC transporter permease [Bacillus niameyensis]|uniref:methionine ABC transporter permease n=1 Tax=Bacillus niameyensis TaxID=1522308 RepID=UPI000780CF14|nr:methionine ABC transporter permease [Bacillus niameyensis]